MSGSYHDFWIIMGMIAVATTAANVNSVQSHRTSSVEAISVRQITLDTPVRTPIVAEKKEVLVAFPKIADQKTSEDKPTIVGVSSPDGLGQTVVDKPAPEVSALEVRAIKEQPKVYEPTEQPIAEDGAQGGEVIASVKEAMQIAVPTKERLEPTVPENHEVFTTTTLNMRSGPGTKYPTVKVVEKGGRLLVSNRSGKWIKVESDEGKVGWVKEDFVSPSNQ